MAIVSVLWVAPSAFSLAFGPRCRWPRPDSADITDFWGMKGGGSAMWGGVVVPTTVIASFQLHLRRHHPGPDHRRDRPTRMKFGSFCLFRQPLGSS